MMIRMFSGLAAAVLTLLLGAPAHADLSSAARGVLSQKVASYKVLASQVATAAKAQINARINILQGEMTAKAILATSAEQLQLYNEFGATTGQGPQVCDAVNTRNDIDSIGAARDTYRFTSMRGAGRAAASPDEYEPRRAMDRLNEYCSADEHNLGLCTSRFDGMASVSSSYTKVTLPDQYTSKQLKGAQDYIANLVPPPLPVRSQGGSCDANCMQTRMASLRLTAMSSMVAVPMASSLSSRIGTKTFADKQ